MTRPKGPERQHDPLEAVRDRARDKRKLKAALNHPTIAQQVRALRGERSAR